ncbi:MAG: hypothetical protein QF893_21375 [Alphaproteobacteria bacterium]|nr:hypothetical protein [Alphaproteobacteria bacterium]
MPNHLKLILSLIIVAVAVVFHYFQGQAGQEVTKWLALGLGAFMIFAIWLFPEAKREAKKKQE